MGARGGGDHNRIQSIVSEQVFDGVNGHGPGLSRRGGAGVGIDVVDSHQFHTIVGREVLGVHPADPAGSEQSDSEHGFPLGCVTMGRTLKLRPRSTDRSEYKAGRWLSRS